MTITVFPWLLVIITFNSLHKGKQEEIFLWGGGVGQCKDLRQVWIDRSITNKSEDKWAVKLEDKGVFITIFLPCLLLVIKYIDLL